MARTLPRCKDCNQCISGTEHTRCRMCWLAAPRKARHLPAAFDLPDWPPLRDYPGQPALRGGYVSIELTTLNNLICSLGPWRPARWAQTVDAINAALPA